MNRTRTPRLRRVVDAVGTRLAEDGQPRYEAFAIGLGCGSRSDERRRVEA